MTIEQMRALLQMCSFDEYTLRIHDNAGNSPPYLQAEYWERDIVSGTRELHKTRKWQLSVHMTRSDIVQTAFKCCLASYENRAREEFKYRGKRIFGPHFDIDKLYDLCAEGREAFDVRKE